jgi:cholesterol oxidase
MNRIASPIAELKPHYTVVVVGSGYGGSIAASRLSRAGQSVCLLERGRELLPGEYPDSEFEALREFQLDLPAGRQGSSTGLYDFRVNPDINVFVGCGLGGTSLVNANVALQPEARVFDDPRWPRALREELADLQAGFSRARSMLGAAPYPASGPVPAKLEALAASGRHLRRPGGAARPPIAVTFTDGPNAAGVMQRRCTLCGDCVSGCNHGAKNTVLMNYLPDAKAFGAEIFTCVAVRRLARAADGWQVFFRLLEAGREVFDAPEQFITADHVILAAGSLGSTEILLRSRQSGLPLSGELGRHFTGNGDVLGFAYNCDRPIHGIGRGRLPVEQDTPVGPTITGIIDLRRQPELETGLVIEEGALPGALAGLIPTLFALAAKAMGRDTDSGLADSLREKQREVQSLVRGAYHGAIDNSQTFLVMAHDDGSGQLVLKDDRVRIDWPGVGRQALFERINRLLEKATHPLGGTYLPNPLWHPLLGQDLITVHPMGGCIMAENAEHGVVNHAGQVFAGTAGETVHPGLYVLDGAIVPRSLGVNPLLTISALAERGSVLIARREGWNIDWASRAAPQAPQSSVTPGLRFTERMAGHLFLGPAADFVEAEQKGRAVSSPCEFVLTIHSDDLDAMLVDTLHRARLTGSVILPVLDPGPLSVSQGWFELFSGDPASATTRRMIYRLELAAPDGRRFRFEGFKRVHQDPGLDLWADTTTLFVTLFEKTVGGETLVGKGILRIAPRDLLRQLGTMEVTGVAEPLTRLRYMARFGAFFAGTLCDVYGGIAARSSVFDPDAPPRKRRELRLDPPEIFDLSAGDGTRLRLTRYHGGTKGPVLLVHGLGVSSRIFTIDTIDTNLAEYLFAHGYDLWLLDYRSSIELPASRSQYTADEIARLDFPAAVARVLAETGRTSVQAVVHCFGATTFVMAMLAGLEGVRSALISQIATHIRAPLATRFKTGLHLPTVLKALGVNSLSAYTDLHADWREKLFDEMLRLQPVSFEERCTSPVCHRITFLYGTLYEHRRLNRATHEALHEMFGVASISALEHLALMVRRGQVVSAAGEDLYLPQLERLAIPITFIHGAENGCYSPESTAIAFDALRRKNGDLYQRHVIAGYGHIDCIFGADAVRDVYPLILQHLEQSRPEE